MREFKTGDRVIDNEKDIGTVKNADNQDKIVIEFDSVVPYLGNIIVEKPANQLKLWEGDK